MVEIFVAGVDADWPSSLLHGAGHGTVLQCQLCQGSFQNVKSLGLMIGISRNIKFTPTTNPEGLHFTVRCIHRISKCHGYDRYVGVEMFTCWGKKFGTFQN